MSISSLINDTSPGGKITPMVPHPKAEDVAVCRTLSEYAWSQANHLDRAPTFCAGQSPRDGSGCHCEVRPTQFTPRSQAYDPDDYPYTPDCLRRRGSDSTVSEIFERPSADPKVSPHQLPALCTHSDSDDEVYESGHGQAPVDTAPTSPSKNYEIPTCSEGLRAPTGSEGLHLLATASFCVSVIDPVAPDLPQLERTALVSKAFEFMPPATAPAYPSLLHVDRPEGAPESPELVGGALVLAANWAMNRAMLSHPRPCDDDRFESDAKFVALLQRPDALNNELSLHKKLCDRSKAPDPTSYAQAGAYMQRRIRKLLTQHPTWAVDTVTPTTLPFFTPPPPTFHCAFADCPAEIPHDRAGAEKHIREAHWLKRAGEPKQASQKVRVRCPLCPEEAKTIQQANLGRHILALHADTRMVVPRPPVQCKLCEQVCTDIRVYAEKHFDACQDAHPRVQEPPRKKQRIE
ncbi:hypothetical protein FB451DRAFT_1556446 [Mycena latifolia]|nr:hypothetical protein FB451DRAFT_1556446 [Mycena latifolia]